MAVVTKSISAPRLECLMVWREMPFLIMIKFVLNVIAKGTLLNIAEQVMVVNEAIFMHKVDQTVVLENPAICFYCGIAGHIAVNCLSYSENSVCPRAAESFSRGNSESKQIPNNGEKDPSKIRLTAAAAANKKKVIMIEAKVNTLESLCVVDTGASVSLLGQSQWGAN